MLPGILGGVNAASSILGSAFSNKKRIVDPFTQQAVDQLNAAQQTNQNAYESNLAAGSRNMNAMSNDAYKQVAGSMANNGYDSADASMQAVAATKSGSMLGDYMNNRNNATNQYTQNSANIASKIGEQAAQVAYEESNPIAKVGKGIADTTSGIMSGINDGMKLQSVIRSQKFNDENQDNATTDDVAKQAVANQKVATNVGMGTGVAALLGPTAGAGTLMMLNAQQKKQPQNTVTPAVQKTQIPATIAAPAANNAQSAAAAAGGTGPIDWWSQKIKPKTIFANY